MPRRRKFLPWIAALFLFPITAAAGTFPAPEGTGKRRIAVTFDDLPAVASLAGPCDEEALVALSRRLLEGLQAHQVQATALVTGGRICDTLSSTALPRILEMWLARGHDLGSHTYSHPDLNSTRLDTYRADIIRNEAILKSVLSASDRELRFFRHPFLHSGDDPDKKAAIDGLLEARGYRIAPVTLDSQEWIFAAVYLQAKRDGDDALVRRVADGYIDFMKEVMSFYEGWSVEVLGYELPQILLLHVNELNADTFGRLAAMLMERRYRFASLDEALEDPAYRRGNPYVGPRGLSWLHRWALDQGMPLRQEPREPAWLAELFRSLSGTESRGPSASAEEPLPRIGETVEINDELTVTFIEEGVHLVVHEVPFAANSLLVEMADGTLVLGDTPYDDETTRALLEWMRARFGTDRRIVAVNSHFHADALGGNGALHQAGVETYGSELSARMLEERGEGMRTQLLEYLSDDPRLSARFREARWEPPARRFGRDRKEWEVKIGEESMVLRHPGAAHSPDNIVLWFPDRRILFGGCMVRAGSTLPSVTDADVENWPLAVEDLRRFDARLVVPGHGRVGGVELLDNTLAAIENWKSTRDEQ